MRTPKDRYALAAIAGLCVVLAMSLYSGGIVERLTGAGAPPAADAISDFWLRAGPGEAADRVSFVRASSRLEILDQRSGDALDPTLPEPDRWYRVRVLPGGETGWAYTGWLDRGR
jgi:hypothetical protein